MKLKKIILSFTIIIFIIQYGFGIICNATEKESQIVILNDFSEIQQNLEPMESSNENELKIYSEAAILIDKTTGKVLYNKDMYARKYPASTTKILTAIIAIEKCDLKEMATASHTAVFSVKSGYSIANIQEGERFTIGELLDVLMIQSANEAANVIAEHISGSIEEFAKLMNQKAKEIGCLDSNFVNANGAHDENHYSTAYDLALIAKYCMENSTFREIVKKESCSLQKTDIYTEERIFKNTNSLMQENSKYYYPYCNGIKTGFTTPAKNCLISSSNKDGFELISVVLHAEATEDELSARYTDTINLFEYGYNNYSYEDILKEYNIAGNVTTNNLKNTITNKKEESNENLNIENNNLKNEENFEIENDKTIETVGGVVKNEYDYNNVEKSKNYLSWLQIFVGIFILFIVGKYYFIKKIKETISVRKIKELQEKEIKKDNLYNFKLS